MHLSGSYLIVLILLAFNLNDARQIDHEFISSDWWQHIFLGTDILDKTIKWGIPAWGIEMMDMLMCAGF